MNIKSKEEVAQMATSDLLQLIESLGQIQDVNKPTSLAWRNASKELAPLFKEMARRTQGQKT